MTTSEIRRSSRLRPHQVPSIGSSRVRASSACVVASLLVFRRERNAPARVGKLPHGFHREAGCCCFAFQVFKQEWLAHEQCALMAKKLAFLCETAQAFNTLGQPVNAQVRGIRRTRI